MIIAGILVIDVDFDFESRYLVDVWTDVDKLAIQIREEKRLRPDQQLYIYKNWKDAYGLFSSERQPKLLKFSDVDDD